MPMNKKHIRFPLLFGILQLLFLILFFFNCFRYYYNSTQNYWFSHNYLYPAAVVLAVISVVIYRKYYLQDFRYYVLFFLWSLLTTLIRYLVFKDNSDFSYNFQLLTAIFVALPLIAAFPKKTCLWFLRLLMSVCVLFLTLAGIIALVFVVGNLVLLNPYDNQQIFGLIKITGSYRLAMWANPNLVGMTYMTALWLSVYLASFCKKSIHKGLFSFCGIINWLVLLLSDSRTCLYAFAVSFSLYLAYRYFHSDLKSSFSNRGYSTAVVAVACFFAVLLLDCLALDSVRLVRSVISPLIDPNRLFSSLLQISSSSGIGADRPLTTVTQGRLLIWINAVKTIIKYPYILLIGTSVSEVANVIRYYSPYLYPHLHNSWLHILLAYGIIGLVLALTAVFHSLKTMARQLFVFFDSLPAELKMMPFIVLAILLTSLLESSLFNLSNIIYFENTWFFILIGYCAVYPKLS